MYFRRERFKNFGCAVSGRWREVAEVSRSLGFVYILEAILEAMEPLNIL